MRCLIFLHFCVLPELLFRLSTAFNLPTCNYAQPNVVGHPLSSARDIKFLPMLVIHFLRHVHSALGFMEAAAAAGSANDLLEQAVDALLQINEQLESIIARHSSLFPCSLPDSKFYHATLFPHAFHGSTVASAVVFFSSIVDDADNALMGTLSDQEMNALNAFEEK